MKKQLFSLAVLCAMAFTVNAQTEKGQNMVGGSIMYGSNNQNTPTRSVNSYTTNTIAKYKNFGSSISIGHFFSKNLAIGLNVGYNYSKSNSDYDSAVPGTPYSVSSSSKKNNFYVGPFVRYYVDIVDRFKFFGQGNFNIGFGKTKESFLTSNNYPGSISNYKNTTYNGSINPGFAFFPSKKWAVEFSFPLLSYDYLNQKDDGENIESQPQGVNKSFIFGFSSFNPSIGFKFHF